MSTQKYVDDDDSQLKINLVQDSVLQKPDLQDKNSFNKHSPPEDKNSVVYYSFLFMGCTILMPWSAVLNSFDFFIHKMPGYFPESIYPFSNFALVALAQVLLLFVGDRITWSNRVVIGFLMTGILLYFVPFLACLPLGWNFYAVFILLIPFGFFSGVCQGTIFTMAAQLPFKYMGAVMLGNGLSAIFCNGLRGITLATLPFNPDDESTFYNAYLSAVIFNVICASFLIASVVLQIFVLKRNAFYIYYFDWDVAEQERQNNDNEDQDQMQYDIGNTKIDLTVGTQITSDSDLASPIGFPSSFKQPKSIAVAPEKETCKNFIAVVKRNFVTTNGLLYTIMAVFALTFSVFPAVTFDAELKMLKSISNSDGWFVLMMNTIFSIFDTVGRKMGGSATFDISITSIKVLSVVRIIFVATFYLIAFQVGPSWLFVSDWFIIFNMILFSWSNGYTGTLCAVKGPNQVPEERRGQVGSFIGTCLTTGICFGTIIAFATTPILAMTPGIQKKNI